MTVLRVLSLAVLAVSLLGAPSWAADKKAAEAAPAAAKAGPNIAVVDVQMILTDSKAAKNIQSQLKAKRDALQAEFIKLEEKLRSDEKALTEQKAKGDEAAFKAKREAFEKKLLETQTSVQKKKTELERAVVDSTEVLRDALLKVVAEISEAKKFDVVLTRQHVVIADKSLDITDQVLAKLNATLTEVPLKAKGK